MEAQDSIVRLRAEFQPSARVLDVRAEDIREFALAIGAADPIHFDRELAVANGFRDVVAPRSFYLALGLARGLTDDPARLGLDGVPVDQQLPGFRVAAGGADVSFAGPIVAGSSVRIDQGLHDIELKRGRSMELIIMTLARDYYQDDVPVVCEKYVRILSELQ